jgi:hypothetical protein
LTGTTPFCGGTAIEVMVRQTRDRVIPPSECRPDRDIPPQIDDVVLQALDKRPDARFADAAAFAGALRAAAGVLGASRSRTAAAEESTRPPSPRRNDRAAQSGAQLARGSDCSTAMLGDPEALRQQIGDALRRGDVTAIADGYLALANALVDRRQVARATSELREGIDILTAGCAARTSVAPTCVDRVIVALAALYDDDGDPRYARHLAASTDRSPTSRYAIG